MTMRQRLRTTCGLEGFIDQGVPYYLLEEANCAIYQEAQYSDTFKKSTVDYPHWERKWESVTSSPYKLVDSADWVIAYADVTRTIPEFIEWWKTQAQ